MKSNIAGSLQNAKDMLRTIERNIVETQVPGSKAIDTSLNVSSVGSRGQFRTDVVNIRREDSYKTQVLFASVTSASNKEVIANSLKNLQQVIGDAADPNKSLLVEAVIDFISQSKILTANNDTSTKRAFINKGLSLASTINNGIDKVNGLRKEADNSIVSGLQSLNDTIRSLNTLNQTILLSKSPQTLYNTRDSLVQDICKKLDVQVSFGRKGVAVVTTKGSGYELVSENKRGSFSYSGASTDDISLGQDISDIIFTGYNKQNQVVQSPVVFIGGSNDPSIRLITGGEIEALVNLRDIDLPLSLQAFNSLATGIVSTVNDIHNSGSTWPPKTAFTGTTLVRGGETIDLQGAVSFFALDDFGRQLTNGAGNINPAVIDFTTFKGTGVGGNPTIQDLINEINQKLNLSPTRDRAAIGRILDSDGNQIVGEYLINNIQLAGMSKIDANGNWMFDLDLQGNSFYGSKVEVTQVSVSQPPAPGIPTYIDPDYLPPSFRLNTDTDTRTNQPITLGGFVQNGGIATVNLQIQVTGDNGVVSNGTVTFAVDQTQAQLNQRFAYDNSLGIQGDFNNHVLSGPGIGVAMLVDDKGQQIDPLNASMQGNLAIKTNDSSFRIAIQGGNFSNLFGLNNFFEVDKNNGQISVNDNIINDPIQLSTGQVTSSTNSKVLTVGEDKATATMRFTGNFRNGDTVTIDGKVFTFGPIPGQISANYLAADLPNLAEQCENALPNFEFAFNATTLTITAKSGGTWGNNINVAVNLAGSTISINDNIPGPIKAGTLVGGTNKQSTIQVARYDIGSGSVEVLRDIQNLTDTLFNFTGLGTAQGNYTVTLENFATLVSASISEQYNQADANNKVSETALDVLYKEDNELFGTSLEDQWLRSLELMQFMKGLANFSKMVNNIESRIVDIIFG